MENEFHLISADTQASNESVVEPEHTQGEDFSTLLQTENETARICDRATQKNREEAGDNFESPNSEEVLSPKETVMPENIMIEKGFATMEAQLAYYEFVDAAGRVNSETGEEAELFFKALSTLNKHLDELSLLKLFSVLGILLRVLIIFWTYRAINQFPKKEAVAL